MVALLALSVALADPPAVAAETHGQDHGRGNLVGIQPWLTAADYAGADTLRARLVPCFDLAKERGWLLPDTVVVLPESIGTWLVAAGEKTDVYAAPTMSAATKLLRKRHFLPVLARALASAGTSSRTEALLRLKGDEMAAGYDAVFSDLARTYGVTVVAGSIALPAPEVADGHVVAGRGRVQNVGAVYGPDGKAHASLVRQAQPGEPLPFVKGQPAADLPVFATPLGNVGVLLGADAWDPDAYDAVAGHDADVIVAPALLPGDGSWATPWTGAVAADLDAGAPATTGDAWALALANRSADADAELGLQVFLRGRIWDLSGDGRTIATTSREVTLGAEVAGPAVFNQWLGDEPLTPEAEDSADADGAPAHPR